MIFLYILFTLLFRFVHRFSNGLTGARETGGGHMEVALISLIAGVGVIG